MGTAVLRSLDPLKDRLHLDSFGSRTPPPMKSSSRNPPRSSPSASPPGRTHPPPLRKPARSPPRLTPKPAGRRVSFADKNTDAVVVKLPSRKLVMEEVKILKRGDELRPSMAAASRQLGLPAATSDGDDGFSTLFSTDRLGPEPEILPKQIGFSETRQVYAGPAFVTSPSPSSLPLPVAFLKKGGTDEEAVHSDLSTKSLRCLLQLDGLP